MNPDARRVEHRRIVDPTRYSSLFLISGELLLEELGVVISLDRLWKDLDRVTGGEGG